MSTPPGQLWLMLSELASRSHMMGAQHHLNLGRRARERGECTDEHAREILRTANPDAIATLRSNLRSNLRYGGTQKDIELAARMVAGVLDVDVLARTPGTVVVAITRAEHLDEIARAEVQLQCDLARAAGVSLRVVLGPAWQQGVDGAIYPLREQHEDWLATLMCKGERALMSIERSVKQGVANQRRDFWELWVSRVNAELSRPGRIWHGDAEPSVR